MRLVVATSNWHKLVEIELILAGLPLAVEPLSRHARVPAPAETGRSFADNARDKVRYYSRAVPHLTVAEDSGLEIDALDGAPGVHSARFNGETYAEKFRAIYALLLARGATTSTARFVCAVAVAERGRVVFETTGVVNGRIAGVPRGHGGFGYDPIFFYPPFDRTLAEVSPEKKATVSHRGKAFRALRAFLQSGWQPQTDPVTG